MCPAAMRVRCTPPRTETTDLCRRSSPQPPGAFRPCWRLDEDADSGPGYWGAEYLLDMKRRYGVDVVTRAQHEDLAVVRDLEGLTSEVETVWCAKRETHSRLGEMEVRAPDSRVSIYTTGKAGSWASSTPSSPTSMTSRAGAGATRPERRGRASTIWRRSRARRTRIAFGGSIGNGGSSRIRDFGASPRSEPSIVWRAGVSTR